MKIPDNLPDNDEHFEAWILDEIFNHSLKPGEKFPRNIAFTYDTKGNITIGPESILATHSKSKKKL